MSRLLAAVVVAFLVCVVPAAAGTLSHDLAVTLADSPDPVTAGANLTYTATVDNQGASAASNVQLGVNVPPGTTFASVSAPDGWSCTTPAVGAAGSVTCTSPSLPVGATAVFTLVVQTDAGLAGGSTISAGANVALSETDADPSDNTALQSTTVAAATADLSLTMSDTPDPVLPGGTLTTTLVLQNSGADAADTALTVPLPAQLRFQSISAPGGWTCTTPAVGATGSVSCTHPSVAAGSPTFTLVTQVDPATPSGSTIASSASVTSTTADPDSADRSATATTTVGGPADLRTSVTATPASVRPGANVAFAIVVENDGPHAVTSATLAGAVPAGSTFVRLDAPAGWTCTTPLPGAAGPVSCTRPALATGAAQRFELVVAVDAAAGDGARVTVAATAGSAAPDPDPSDDTGAATATVARPATQTTSTTATTADAPPPPAPPAGRRLVCRRVPTLVRHSISGARWILARDGCRVTLRRVGTYRRGGRKRNRITSQSVRPGTPLYEGDTLTVRINGRRR